VYSVWSRNVRRVRAECSSSKRENIIHSYRSLNSQKHSYHSLKLATKPRKHNYRASQSNTKYHSLISLTKLATKPLTNTIFVLRTRTLTNRYTSTQGSTECTECPAGEESHLDEGSSKCDPLPAGQYGNGAICPLNTYSEKGSVECTTCPSGKFSYSPETGASQCIKCDFMYRLSKHCEFPITGALLILSTIIVGTVFFLLFQRYKKKQDRIKENLRIDLFRQKKLVKTKQTDINLMTGAWKLSPTEVKLEEKIATGAYGEVWRGALHDRWIVAIKKLYHSSSSSSSSTTFSRRSNKLRSMRSSSNELLQDSEIRFLMRKCSRISLASLTLVFEYHSLNSQQNHSNTISTRILNQRSNVQVLVMSAWSCFWVVAPARMVIVFLSRSSWTVEV